MGQPKRQADYRKTIVAKDQFGRAWLMNIETATGCPTGGIQSCGWTDPLRTPQRMIEVPKDEFNQPRWGHCVINIAQWMRNIKAADNEWSARLNAAGVHQYKNLFKPHLALEDAYLLELAGPRPWPSVRCLEEARMGNEYLLGQVKNEHGQSILDEEAERLMEYRNIILDPVKVDENEFNIARAKQDAIPGIPADDASMAPEEVTTVTGTGREDYQEFMRQGKKAGLAYAEILVGWAEHKKMVAEAPGA